MKIIGLELEFPRFLNQDLSKALAEHSLTVKTRDAFPIFAERYLPPCWENRREHYALCDIICPLISTIGQNLLHAALKYLHYNL